MVSNIELGSEFNISLNDLNIVEDNLFAYFKDYDVQWYDYGRSAIRNIPIKKNKKILMPEFICESVTNCFDSSMIEFYKIDDHFNIDIDDLMCKLNDTVGCIYIAHYFGYLQKAETSDVIKENAKRYEIIIIEDATQSLFSKHELIGDYAIASIRKWLPTPMGAVLYTRRGGDLPICGNNINVNNEKAYGMILKDMFLKTGYDTNTKYREIFISTEQKIDEEHQIRCLSDFSKFLISCENVSNLCIKRKRNVERLEQGLKCLGIQAIRKFEINEVPFVYPLRVIKGRDEFRKYLTNNRIYCAVHWPFDGVMPQMRKNGLYNAQTIISLPVDQRYGNEEIDYMLDKISKYGGELLR